MDALGAWRNILVTGGKALLIMGLGLLLIRILLFFFRKALKKTGIDPALHSFILNATRIILIISLSIMILQQIGVKAGSLIAVLGAGAAAVALAVRDSLSNVAGGLMLILTKPFKRGDEINITGDVQAGGIVDRIELLTTRLTSYDNKQIIIPNGKLINSVVTNSSARSTRRIEAVYRLDAGQDLAKVRHILYDFVRADPMFLDDPPPFDGVTDHEAGLVTFRFYCWVRTADFYAGTYRLNEQAGVALREVGIRECPTLTGVRLESSACDEKQIVR